MIAVMGASGHTGSKITEALLNAGKKVRALGRSESKLAAHQRAGAEIRLGDAADATFLADAFRGAEAVYTLIAPAPQSNDYRDAQDRHGHAIVSAIRESGVRHVVALSSLGANQAVSSGVISGLRAQEKRIEQLKDANVLILRPATFFENFESSLGLIKAMGLCGDAIAAELAIPMVATRDLADVATKALRSRDWNGIVVRELLGPCDISYAEATSMLGERIGCPDLKYVQFADEYMIKGLVQSGLSESFGHLYIEMTRAINAQQLAPVNGRTTTNTTPTRFENIAEELAQVYRAM